MILNDSVRIEALQSLLPCLREYFGSTFVIKYGGAAMKNFSNISYVIDDILFLYYLGIKPVVVHGGGPLINDWLTKVNIEPKFNNGLRITDSKTMEIVQMVLVGKVNKYLVSLFNKHDNLAIGLSGHDGCLIRAKPLFSEMPDNYIGQVDSINNNIINLLLGSNYIPIIASTGVDKHGQAYNINADTVAGAIAASLNADKLILLTDSSGIMTDMYNQTTIIKNLNINFIRKLKTDGIISGGMIPKSDSCIYALENGVNSAHIIDGRVKHALLYEIFAPKRFGSMITL